MMNITANCILLVLFQNSIPYFIARQNKCCVNPDLGVLCISQTEENNVVCFRASSTEYDHPLYAYCVCGQLYIALKSALVYGADH